jgi:hypothetical protein
MITHREILLNLYVLISIPLCFSHKQLRSGVAASSSSHKLLSSGFVASLLRSALHVPQSLLRVARSSHPSSCLLHSPHGKAVFVPHPPFVQLWCLQAYTSSASPSGLHAAFMLLRSELAQWRILSKASLSASSSLSAGYFVPPKPHQGCSLRSRSVKSGVRRQLC